jgi:predicted house-cleaning NTP pyrophosphatase (Maf/HAM1 superfamily)
VEELSRQKAREVAEKCESEDLVIGADTVVALEGTV